MPFGYGEQAPFLGRKISAIRLGTAPDNDAGAVVDTPGRLNPTRFLRLGRASESILASLDGGIELAGGTAGHVYLGNRIIRGWAIELVLLTTLIPFLAGAIDLFARSRRKRLPLPRRLACAADAVRRLALDRAPRRNRRSGRSVPARLPDPATTGKRRCERLARVVGLAVLGLLVAFGWWQARTGARPGDPAAGDAPS